MTFRPTRRAVMSAAVALPTLIKSSASWAADGDSYPNRRIRIIVPFLAGGAADIVARLVGQHLAEMLGQTVYCENRPGAGSNIGTAYAAGLPPDGYNLLVQGNPLGSNIFLFKNVGYDPKTSFAPIAMHYRDFNTLIVHPDFPANSVKELISVVKEKPNGMTFSSSGNGTSTHLAGELFKQMAGLQITHVPYRGVPPAVEAVVGKHVDMMFAGFGVVSSQVKAGNLKALAVTGIHRIKQAPDLPTVAETLPGFEATTWTGMFAPAGTPEPVIRKLNAAINTILDRSDVGPGLEARGFIVEHMTPERVGEEVERDSVRWGDVIKKTGAHVE